MFESTLEAQGLNDGERRFGSLSTAVLAHAGIVAAIVAVTAIIVPPVILPEPPPDFVRIVSVPPLGELSRRPSDQTRKKGADNPKPAQAVAPRPVEEHPAPVETPSTLPTPAAGPSDSDLDGDGGPPGVPTGLDDGGPGGFGGGLENGTSGEGLPADPVFVTGDMVKPVLLVKIEPEYPSVARKAGMGGRVTVSAVIGLEGGVESAEVLASTNPLFDQAALDAVRKWRYRAATMNGRPVRVYFTVVVDFVVR